MENLSNVMDATNSSQTSNTEDSNALNISVINNYIKTEIEEGKRQAKN